MKVVRCKHGLANCPPCAADREPRWVPVYEDGVPVAMQWFPGAVLEEEDDK